MRRSKKIRLKEDMHLDDRNYDHALVAVLLSFTGMALAAGFVTYLMSL